MGYFKIRTTLACLIMAILLLGAGSLQAAASTPTMGVDELAPGMKGYGLTVFRGVEPEQFDVEIVAVLSRGSSPGSLILVRASGPRIEEAGGVAEGMSGSPVYVDGRLIGAVAYVFPSSDHYIAGVTPIGDMLKMLEYPDDSQLQEMPAAAASGTVYVSGLSPRALGRLSDVMAQRGLKVMPAAGGFGPGAEPQAESEYRLVPGAMVGMQLITGDVGAGLFGTVTYTDGDRFLAFGHPVLTAGQVDLQASGAAVHTIVRSDVVPFKVVSALKEIGAFTQDRLYGAAGVAGREASMVPVTVTVKGDDTGAAVITSSKIASSEPLIDDLFFTVAVGGVDQAIDRIGPGTAELEYVIELDGHEPLRRSDVVWSDSDICYEVVDVAARALGLIVGNAAEEASVRSISVDVQVETGRRTARIVGARALTPEVAPGGVFEIEVQLRRYRGELVTRAVQVQIPEDMIEGPVSFLISGGGSTEDDLDDGEDEMERLLYLPIDELLAELASAPRGDEIVVRMEHYFLDDPFMSEEYGLPLKTEKGSKPVEVSDEMKEAQRAPEAGANEEGDERSEQDAGNRELPVTRVRTEWFVEGSTWVDGEIVAGSLDESDPA
ncbi:MAG: hypothetical protein GX183_05790 [Firmicutes bacterium]|nr:hypothetical protein [Bacillota bacterium]